MAGKVQKALPGFRLSLGFALVYLTLMVLLPLAACVVKAMSMTWPQFWAVVSDPRAVAAYKLSFTVSLLAAIVNSVTGLLVAWVLVRYDFPGRRVLDTLVDLPLALPTAVAGITFATLFQPDGWYGRYFLFLAPDGFVGHWFSKDGWFGRNLFTLDVRLYDGPLAIVVVLVFVGLPFVIRALQPVLAELDAEQEEAAAILGAGRWQTFRYVIFPAIVPALLTGFALAFARGLGEYGSVIFVSSNIRGQTEIPPTLIIEFLSEYDPVNQTFGYDRATAIAVVLLAFSFLTLIAINLLERWSRRFDPTS